MTKYYQYKYYLNASHSFDGLPSHAHAHTFTITLCIQVKQEFVSFMTMDKRLENYFGQYAEKYLNMVPEFQEMNPTIENLGDYFYDTLRKRLKDYQMDLMQLEIMETPLRSYIVSNRLLMPTVRGKDNIQRWNDILEKRERLLTSK